MTRSLSLDDVEFVIFSEECAGTNLFKPFIEQVLQLSEIHITAGMNSVNAKCLQASISHSRVIYSSHPPCVKDIFLDMLRNPTLNTNLP